MQLKLQQMEEELERKEKEKAEADEERKRVEEEKQRIAEEKRITEMEVQAKQEELARLAEVAEKESHEKDELREEITGQVDQLRNEYESMTASPPQLLVSEYDDDTTSSSHQFVIVENAPLPEEARSSQMSKDKSLDQKLKELGKELSCSKDQSKLTATDKLHADNLKEGRDKYKTLRQIRRGNTRQRVDEFEAL